MKDKAIAKANTTRTDNEERDTLVFPIHYLEQIKELKSLVHGLKQEITELIGDTRVMFAIKKHG